jgi:recombination protein RecR
MNTTPLPKNHLHTMPDPIKAFIARFARIPSVGPRLATRIAFFLSSLKPDEVDALAEAVRELSTLDTCPQCFAMKLRTLSLCDVCGDRRRNPKIIAIVERDTDRMAIEAVGTFRGHYLILGELPERGVLEPSHRARLAHLASRIRGELDGALDELVIAVGLHTFGDFATSLIREQFAPLANKITRLGRGIPTGGEIEFADEETLRAALERRF